MNQVLMAVLAGSVAAGYFVIAALVAPRIKMPSTTRRVVLTVRAAAIAFFVGCGMTHVHMLVHTLGFGSPQPVEGHELVFHGMQAVGAWLFIVGAILRLELHVVPAQTRAEMQAAVNQQRLLARRAQEIADRDELTGLARRRVFDAHLERLAGLSGPYVAGGALLLIDVDGLKGVNDALGHQAGDDLLKQVGQVIGTGLRGTDVVARIGGDEFAVILPEASTGEAASVADKLVDRVGEIEVPEGPRASISVGATAIRDPVPASDLFGRADEALYLAKRAGGGRHLLSTPTLSPLAGLPRQRPANVTPT